MNELKAIFELDFKSLILAIATILIGFNVFKKAITEFFGWMGIETKWMRDKREEKEDLDALKEHSIEQDGKIEVLVNGMNELKDSVKCITDKIDIMQQREDQNAAARLKDRISESYRDYHKAWKITAREKEALKDLIDAYTKYSENSFVHSLVEVEMEQWDIVPEEEGGNSHEE